MGHSIDITDEDIIKECFELSNKIIIHYHKDSAVGDYVKSLITIYGRKQFDEIRVNKEITFLPHSKILWSDL